MILYIYLLNCLLLYLGINTLVIDYKQSKLILGRPLVFYMTYNPGVSITVYSHVCSQFTLI